MSKLEHSTASCVQIWRKSGSFYTSMRCIWSVLSLTTHEGSCEPSAQCAKLFQQFC